MRSFGDGATGIALLARAACRSLRVIAIVGVVFISMVPTVRAESSPSHAAELFTAATAREAQLRRDIDSGTGGATLLTRTRTLVGAYEDLSRLFPASGYSDDALWHGAMLSADAFWQFGDAADRATALRLFQALTTRFPTSSRVRQVPPQVARLQAARIETTPVTATPKPARSTVAATAPAQLTSIRRELLPDAVRVTLELERETPFSAERTDAPPRLFIELQQTRASDGLKDAALTFDDDIVRQVRVGRTQGNRTRVVLDLQDAGRYSTYALYNPYRVVIDFERTAKPAAKSTRSAVAARPVPKELKTIPSSSTAARLVMAAMPPEATRESPAARPGNTSGTPSPSAAIPPPTANARGGYSLSRQLGLGVARIVIDAGHGGHDPGAKVKGLTEADLVLDIALRLEKLLQKKAGVDVVLTRRDDTFVPLEERTAIANRAGADLFLSIHANASPNAAARGIETYFLNFAANPEAEAIAARENSASSRTLRNLPDIVRAIALNDKIDESRDFAAMVQASLYDELRRSNKEARSLGVKQAPFMVLIGATMPSILAEISFLTNPAEGPLLKTDKYRQQIAEALFSGVMRYQQSLKRASTVASQ